MKFEPGVFRHRVSFDEWPVSVEFKLVLHVRRKETRDVERFIRCTRLTSGDLLVIWCEVVCCQLIVQRVGREPLRFHCGSQVRTRQGLMTECVVGFISMTELWPRSPTHYTNSLTHSLTHPPTQSLKRNSLKRNTNKYYLRQPWSVCTTQTESFVDFYILESSYPTAVVSASIRASPVLSKHTASPNTSWCQ